MTQDNAPAGPPICTAEPPSEAMMAPAMIAVQMPASGLRLTSAFIVCDIEIPSVAP